MEANQKTLHMDAGAIAAEFKEYAYSVSHDLSAPVRAMVEFSKLLKAEHASSISDEGREYLSMIIENGVKMQMMMDGLLQYSRLNTMAKPFSNVDVGKILEDCQVILKPQITTSKARLEIGQMPIIHADAEQLMQVFLALLENALKFQPEGGSPYIKISASETENFWQFAIADNGIGIAPQFQQKILKIFQRLHADDAYSGVGIGLTLAQKIILRHGGRIWCEPHSPQGTLFCFTMAKPCMHA